MIKKYWLLFIIFPITVFLLWQFGCKKGLSLGDEIYYDIRGEWTIIFNNDGRVLDRIKCTFSGSKESGTVTPETGKAGTYVVGGESGYQVEFNFWAFGTTEGYYDQYVGQFIDSNYMEGSSWHLLWAAVRETGQ